MGDLPSGYLTVCHGKSPFLIGKPSINGPFSMAMLNNRRVYNKKNGDFTRESLDLTRKIDGK